LVIPFVRLRVNPTSCREGDATPAVSHMGIGANWTRSVRCWNGVLVSEGWQEACHPSTKVKRSLYGLETGMEDPRWAWGEQIFGMWYFFSSVLWCCWLWKSLGIVHCNALVSCWWRFDWRFARLVAAVVTTASVILSSSKIPNGDILVLAYMVYPEKWPLNECFSLSLTSTLSVWCWKLCLI